MTSPRPMTDSGWFWATVFSAMGLVAIGLIGGKFDVRQRQVEARYLGRQKAHDERVRRAAGLDAVDLADAAVEREVVAPGRIVPLWTLAAFAGTATAFSAAMLWRERHGGPATSRSADD